MKKIIFGLMLLASPLHARQVVLDIPDNDIKIVENDVIDAEQWIKDAWAGKLAKCKSRIIKVEVDRSVQANETLPAGDAAIIQKAFSRTDFKPRKLRDK